MRDSERPTSLDAVDSSILSADTTDNIIVFPHDRTRGPVTAVRNVLLQTSLDELKAKRHYKRYVEQIAPETLEELQAHLAPGWVPIEIAHAHYAACERLGLSNAQTGQLGKSIGDRVQQSSKQGLC
jgi:hypothetical protein